MSSMAGRVPAGQPETPRRENFSEHSSAPVVAQNLRDRRPDLSEDVVGLVAEFLATIKDGVNRRTEQTVPPCEPLARQSRVRHRQAQLDGTEKLPVEEVGVIAGSCEVGREAVARAARALAVRLERRGPQSIPGKGGSR